MSKKKEENKKTGEELDGFLAFRKRGYWLKNKKGKGSYNRHTFNKEDDYEEEINWDYRAHEDVRE